MTVFEKVYQVVRKIPVGKVTTYGRVAKVVGTMPRVVGFALHVSPYEFTAGGAKAVPCHRVVTKEGMLAESFAFGGAHEQKMRLQAEGVRVLEKRIDGASRLVVDKKSFWEKDHSGLDGQSSQI